MNPSRLLTLLRQWRNEAEEAANAAEKTAADPGTGGRQVGRSPEGCGQGPFAELPGPGSGRQLGRPRTADGRSEVRRSQQQDARRDRRFELGDDWCLYASPGEGMVFFSSLTATVGVKDHDRLAKALDKLAAAARKPPAHPATARVAKPNPPTWAIRKTRFAAHDVYYLAHDDKEATGTFTWCLIGKKLVCSELPQNVKAYLLRTADAPLLIRAAGRGREAPREGTAAPVVLRRRGGNVPVYALRCCQRLAAQDSSRPAQDGPRPHAPAHGADDRQVSAFPAISMVRVAPRGIEVTLRQSLPSGNLGGLAVGVGLLDASESIEVAPSQMQSNSPTENSQGTEGNGGNQGTEEDAAPQEQPEPSKPVDRRTAHRPDPSQRRHPRRPWESRRILRHLPASRLHRGDVALIGLAQRIERHTEDLAVAAAEQLGFLTIVGQA